MERKKTLTSNSFDFLIAYIFTLDNSNIHHWHIELIGRQWEKKTHSIRFDCWLTFSCKTQNNNSSFWMKERKSLNPFIYLQFFFCHYFSHWILMIYWFDFAVFVVWLFCCCWMFACFKFIKVNIIINNVPLSFNDGQWWWLVSSEDKERKIVNVLLSGRNIAETSFQYWIVQGWFESISKIIG